MSQKRLIAIGVFVLLIIIYSVVVSRDFGGPMEVGQKWQSQVYEAGTGGTIAMIRIEGVLIDSGESGYGSVGYSHEGMKDMITSAFSSSMVKAVVLYIDSPGGGTYEADELYNLIKKMRAEYPEKPVVVYMGSMATSAAYYISVPADKIFASRNTLTGSIGVILDTYTLNELAKNIGIKEQVFKSGEYKDILNPMREPTDAERAIIQTMVMESYGFFVDAVSEGRGIERDKVLKLADGRFYTATQAVDNGLIDSIGTLDDAINAAADKAQIKKPMIMEYRLGNSSYLAQLLNNLAPSIDLSSLGNLDRLTGRQAPRLLYMPAW